MHLFKVIYVSLVSESIAVRTPQSVELRLACVLVEAFAESSVNEGFCVGLFCLDFSPSVFHFALPGIDNFPFNPDCATKYFEVFKIYHKNLIFQNCEP